MNPGTVKYRMVIRRGLGLFCLFISWTVIALFPVDTRSATLFKTNSAPLPKTAKIFLVAGSSQSANFVQEILDQKKIWLQAGYAAEEIACYYVAPFEEEYTQDKSQYLMLTQSLAQCYPANAKLIREHLTQAGKNLKKDDFFYLYLTSHGKLPVSMGLKKIDPEDFSYPFLKRMSQYPVLNHYRLAIEALPDGTATSAEILGALRAGMDPQDLYLTPRFLKETLEKSFKDQPKYIVIQGCYSGGFLQDPREAYQQYLPTTLENITVLTASRHDRQSFGCEPGTRVSFFGGAFNKILAKSLSDPRKLNWNKLYEELKKAITVLEDQNQYLMPSLPAFFSKSGST